MLYLSQAIGRPVRDPHGEPIGKVADLIVAVGDRYPPVTGPRRRDRSAPDLPALVVGRARSTRPARACARRRIDIAKFQQRPNEILPAGRPAGQADRRHRRPQGRPRQRPPPRRGRGRAAPRRRRRRCRRAAAAARHRGRRTGSLARNLRLPLPERYIDWEDVDPVESSIASIKLRVPHARPGRAPPGRPRRRSSTSSRRRTGPASSPRSTTRRWPTRSRRWSPRPRSRSSRTSSPSAPPTSSRR